MTIETKLELLTHRVEELERLVRSLVPEKLSLSASPPEGQPRALAASKSPRHAPTVSLLVRLFSEALGAAYRVSAGDGVQIANLLKWPEATDEEIERRARIALSDPWWGPKMTIRAFVSQWANWAKSRQYSAARDARAGSVRAEDCEHPTAAGYMDLKTGEVKPR
jgi:hypothetical protein